jgi:hypothetical protein
MLTTCNKFVHPAHHAPPALWTRHNSGTVPHRPCRLSTAGALGAPMACHITLAALPLGRRACSGTAGARGLASHPASRRLPRASAIPGAIQLGSPPARAPPTLTLSSRQPKPPAGSRLGHTPSAHRDAPRRLSLPLETSFPPVSQAKAPFLPTSLISHIKFLHYQPEGTTSHRHATSHLILGGERV